MKVNIVVPFYKNHSTIENLLRSVDGQDYKNLDVTVVVDGSDSDAESALKGFVDNKVFNVDLKYIVLKENQGASAARNLGAYESKGDVLFFVDGDCNLYPGMVRECVTQLEMNPNISYVYGNYRFDNKYEFISQDFDPYLLETMNYICTMSPIRREDFEAIGGFKVGQEYFQDWSLFYRLSKEGYNGKWIREFIFNTTSPTEENQSGTKGMTLDEKCKVFRDEHGIEDKKLAATTFGAPLQSIQRAKMLNADYVGPAKSGNRAIFPNNYFFKNWKATYLTGCYSNTMEGLANHISATVGRPIIHFIGTDTFQLLNEHSWVGLKAIKAAFKECNAKLLCNSPRLVDEMAEVGFDTELLYTPLQNIDQYEVKKKLPKKFTVGVYFSDTPNMNALDGAGGMSNVPLVHDAAKSMPDINFKFFGGQGQMVKKKDCTLINKQDNVEFCGRIEEGDMVDFINSCSAVVRATIHDGFPQLPIQFLLCGRKALVSCPDDSLKYTEKLSFEDVTDYDSAKDELITKIYAMADSKPISKEEVAGIKGYYKELMSEDKFIGRINEIVEEIK